MCYSCPALLTGRSTSRFRARRQLNKALGTQIKIDIEFSIWLATKTRWAHLTKVISMPIVPRVGEFMKFRNVAVGDYFAFRVSQITYREDGLIEVWTELLDNVDERMYSFEDESEFDEYFASYIAEGWACHEGIGPNRRVAGTVTQFPDGA
jgi:hypothetical protein